MRKGNACYHGDAAPAQHIPEAIARAVPHLYSFATTKYYVTKNFATSNGNPGRSLHSKQSPSSHVFAGSVSDLRKS
jgi:hypothetical protein